MGSRKLSRLFTALHCLVFLLNARKESRENWTPAQTGRLDWVGGGYREKWGSYRHLWKKGIRCQAKELAHILQKSEGLLDLGFVPFNPWSPKANGSFFPNRQINTLSVHNIPYDSHWSAYLRTGISSFEGGRHFQRQKINPKMNSFKNASTFYYSCISGIPVY